MNITLVNGIAHLPDGTSIELLAALQECRNAITVVNHSAGETVFNPTATEMLDGVIEALKQ